MPLPSQSPTTGKSPGPANPVDSTQQTYDGSPDNPTFFMNSGDRISVTLHDTEHGLKTQVNDLTTGESGSSEIVVVLRVDAASPARVWSGRVSVNTKSRWVLDHAMRWSMNSTSDSRRVRA